VSCALSEGRLVVSTDDSGVYVVDAETGALLNRVSLNAFVQQVAWLDARRFIVATQHGELIVYFSESEDPADVTSSLVRRSAGIVGYASCIRLAFGCGWMPVFGSAGWRGRNIHGFEIAEDSC
jgi:hypothetical protein